MDCRIIDGIYCEDGKPVHRGIVKIDGVIYYAGHGGVLATGQKVVHSSMTNGLLKHGTYKFDEDGKLTEGFYIPPKRNKSSKKKRRERQKPKLAPVIAVAAALLTVGAVLLAVHLINRIPGGKTTHPGSQELVLPSFEEEVYLCQPQMAKYYRGEITLKKAVATCDNPYAPFVFEYKLPAGTSATLLLDGRTYVLDPEKTSLEIDNLMTGRTYDYEVTVEDRDGTTIRKGHFTTAATNRFVYLPGVRNTRDIGGYMTSSGRRVKEGLLIRGTEIDGLVESEYFLTDKAAAEPFGFVCDLDLRSDVIFEGSYKSRLGEDVDHKFFNSPSYSGIFISGARPFLKAIFETLADPDNYPMYLHCTYGADRTGTVVFLLQGLLGMSEEDMRLEYSLTGFAMHGYETGTGINGIYGGLEGTPGDTISEKIENYLIGEIGITKEQVESIRKIFLD